MKCQRVKLRSMIRSRHYLGCHLLGSVPSSAWPTSVSRSLGRFVVRPGPLPVNDLLSVSTQRAEHHILFALHAPWGTSCSRQLLPLAKGVGVSPARAPSSRPLRISRQANNSMT